MKFGIQPKGGDSIDFCSQRNLMEQKRLADIPGIGCQIRYTVKKSIDLRGVWIYVTECWRRVVLVSGAYVFFVSCLWLPDSENASGGHLHLV